MNDPQLAAAISRLRGEWSETSNGTFEVDTLTLPASSTTAWPEPDVVVFPTRYLGQLCEQQRLRPIRQSVLTSALFDAADIFPLVRDQIIRYGGETMAVPLGVWVPLWCYRTDILEAQGLPPPQTWEKYSELANSLAGTGALPASEPVEFWGAQLLLARVAPLAVQPNREAVLFNPDTMQPRISDPPFLRALENLLQFCGIHGVSTSEAGEAVAVGRAACAIGVTPSGGAWPSWDAQQASTKKLEGVPTIAGLIGWDELPGAIEFYNPSRSAWVPSSGLDRRVSLLGTGGCLISITSSSRNAATAFRLASWLSSSDVASQLGPATVETMPCRRSQLAAAREWFDPRWSRAVGQDAANAVRDALSRQQCLVIPRIPAIDEYLRTMHISVSKAVTGSVSAEEALTEAAASWEEITDRWGRQRQRRAYRRHLNWSD